jgi:hypothetical protein
VAAVEKIANSLQGLEKTGENVVTTTNNMAKSAEKLGSELDKASGKVANSQDKMQVSTKDTVFAFNNLATAAFSIYNAYDRVADYAIQVDRANLMVKTSANAVEDAQVRYNAAVEKFGPASEQARLASQDLALAQERYQVAVERAAMMAGNLNEVILQSALTVIPTSMTALDSIIRITKAFQLAEEGSTLAKFAGIGATIQKRLVDIAAQAQEMIMTKVTWLYNAALAAKNTMTIVGIALVGAAVVAAGVMIAMMNRQTSTTEELNSTVKRSNATFESFSAAMEKSSDITLSFTERVKVLKDEIAAQEEILKASKTRLDEVNQSTAKAESSLNTLNKTSQTAIEKSAEMSGALILEGDLRGHTTETQKQQTATLNNQIAANKKEAETLDESITAGEKYVDVLTERTDATQKLAAVEQFYFQAYVKNTEAWKTSTETAARKVKAILEDTTMSMEQKTEASSAIISQFAAQWETLGKALGMTWEDFLKLISSSIEGIIKEENKLADETEKTLQKHADWLENAYFNRVTQKTEKFTSDLQLYGNAYNLWLGLSTDMTIAIVQQFADKWGLTWDTAAKILEDYVNEQAALLDEKNNALAEANAEAERLMQEHLSTISTYYFESYTAKTEEFIDSQRGFAEEFIDILENQNIDTQTKLSMAESLISQFAAQWGISWQDAEKLIQDAVAAIEAATAQVPKTIKEQLIDRAQANLEAFKNCASGKFYDITKDSKASWDTLVTDTNDLITAGLLGQAQDNIQAFVDCSTNKQADMVKQIDGYLADLTQEYDANIAKIAELVAAGKTEEAAILEAANAEIMAKIQQLEEWKQMIIQESWNTINATTAQGVANEIAQIALLQGRWEALYTLLETKGVGGDRYMPEPPQAGEGLVIPTLPITPILETPALPIPTIPPAPAIPTPTPPILQINSPLVVVEGSADEATVKMAAQEVLNQLKSVIVEPSSSGAPATSKNIRVRSVIGK